MPRTTFEGMLVFALDSAPGIPDGPTEAELTAGEEITSEIPVNGVNFGGSANNASQAMLGDAFVAESPGTWGSALELTYMVDPSGAGIADGRFTYRAEMWMVFVLDPATPEVAADGDGCYVYHVVSHKPIPTASAENEFQKKTVTLAVQEAPELNAVIGGS